MNERRRRFKRGMGAFVVRLSFTFSFLLSWIALPISSAQAQWGPGSRAFRHEAPIIGAWQGEFEGRTIEIALWPSTMTHALAGVMAWGDCRAVLRVSGSDLSSGPGGTTKEITDANPNLERYLFSFASYPGQINMAGNECPGEGRPGYRGFYLNADESFEELAMYSYSTYPALRRYASALRRSTPSRELTEAVIWLDTKTSVTLTTMAENVVKDPALNYLQLSDAQFATRMDDIDELTYVSEIGTIYRIDRTNSNHPDRQYFTLVVVDNDFSMLPDIEVGETGGEGYFVPASQEVLITPYRSAAQCDIVELPYTIYTLTSGDQQDTDSRSSVTTAEDTSSIWALSSSNGMCLNFNINGLCQVTSCSDWAKELYPQSSVLPVISGSRAKARLQAERIRAEF